MTMISHNHQDPSSSGLPLWSINSLKAILPDSPSPICSSGGSSSHSIISPCSPESDTFYSEIGTEFSTSRSKSIGTCSNDSQRFSSTVEIIEWKEQAQKFGLFKTSHPTKDAPTLWKNGGPKGKLRVSSLCETFSAVPSYEIPRLKKLPSVKEEINSIYDGQRSLPCIKSIYSGSSIDERQKLMSRPKPYSAFLNEVKRQKRESQMDALRKAEHIKLMQKMRKKEAAIDEWEFKQTRKTLKEMKNLESKLERIRIQASERTQKRLKAVKEKANKQKMNVRQSTSEKISASSEFSNSQFSGDSIWLKIASFC